MFEILILKGADVNAQITVRTYEDSYSSSTYGGETPLHYAAKNNSKEMIKVLISKGADISAEDIFYQIINYYF